MRAPDWSAAEIGTLLTEYPTGGLPACVDALPHRSRYAVRNKIQWLHDRGALGHRGSRIAPGRGPRPKPSARVKATSAIAGAERAGRFDSTGLLERLALGLPRRKAA